MDPLALPDGRGVRGASGFSIHGMDGDTISGILERAVRYLKTYRRVHAIMIVGGANDVLLPYFLNLQDPADEPRRQLALQLTHRGRVPLADPESYIVRLHEGLVPLISVLEEQGKSVDSIAVTTIPPLGEEHSSPPNLTAALINTRIRALSDDLGFTCLDLAQVLWEVVRDSEGSGTSSYCLDDPAKLAEDARIIRDRGADASMSISASRGLAVTTDGIHLNSFGAETVFRLFDHFFRTILK